MSQRRRGPSIILQFTGKDRLFKTNTLEAPTFPFVTPSTEETSPSFHSSFLSLRNPRLFQVLFSFPLLSLIKRSTYVVSPECLVNGPAERFMVRDRNEPEIQLA